MPPVASHTYIRVVDPDGNTRTEVHGLPTDKVSGKVFRSVGNHDDDYIKAYMYPPGKEAWPGNDHASYDLARVPESSINDVMNRLEMATHMINTTPGEEPGGINYYKLGPNSNSIMRTAVEHGLGYPLPKDFPPEILGAPGTQYDIIRDREKPWAIKGQPVQPVPSCNADAVPTN